MRPLCCSRGPYTLKYRSPTTVLLIEGSGGWAILSNRRRTKLSNTSFEYPYTFNGRSFSATGANVSLSPYTAAVDAYTSGISRTVANASSSFEYVKLLSIM